MNEAQIKRLAMAVSDLRPDWLGSSLTTFITRHLAKRPYRDVAVALTWVATDMNPDGTPVTDTPARVLENGPWWRAATVEHPEQLLGKNPTAATACRVCGRHVEQCICGERVTRPAPPLNAAARRAAANAVRTAAGFTPREDA